MEKLSDYLIVTFQRKPGVWRASIRPKMITGEFVPGVTVLTVVTPFDSASEADANHAAERLIMRL
jgi:hypothetical protein